MGDDISCGARSWMNKLPSQPICSTARGHFLRNDQVDASDEPIRSTARVGATHSRATLPPAILSRHRSAPSRTAIDNDELDFRPPRAEYSANIRRSSPRVRASTLVPESREPMITILDTSNHTLPNDTSSRTSRVSFETRPPPLGLPSPRILSSVALAAKQHIIHTLQNLSQSESYATSPYFQQIFNQCIDNVKKYSEELRDVNEALRMCFEVNESLGEGTYPGEELPSVAPAG